jgi:hypothetical protein
MRLKLMQGTVFDKMEESGLENTSRQYEIEKKYANNLAIREEAALEKYGKMRYSWQRNRFIKKLAKKGEYFSAYSAHISRFYSHKEAFNERLITLLADKLANKLLENNLSGLLSTYAYEMYWMGGLSENAANNRLKDLLNKNNVPLSQINKILKGNYEAIGSQRLRNEIYRQNILPKGF